MSVDLYGCDGRYMKISTARWCKSLQLGEKHGWKPAGTVAPATVGYDRRSRPWHGDYTSNCGQIVSAEDAHNLAAALERSLLHISEQDSPTWHPDAAVLQRALREPGIKTLVAFARSTDA